MNDTQINDYINKYLPVKLKEKDKYGEVFTPPHLINDILDLFPSAVWTNPHLKWFDPSAGVGFFMIFVFKRLLTGLQSWEPNLKKRSSHILNKMIYMAEINKTNCRIIQAFFGPNANIFCGDFLDYPLNSFNCIVGNPPFNDDYGLNNDGKRILGGKNKLYERIFIKSYHLLDRYGFLAFIVPANMFSGNGSDAYRIFLENSIPVIHFNSSNKRWFPTIQHDLCYFLLEKTEEISKNTNKTVIQYNNSEFTAILKDRPVNPIMNWTPKTEKLIDTFVSNERNAVIYNRGKNKSAYRGTKYRVVYTPTTTLGTNNSDLAVGLSQPKAIVFAISPKLEFVMDYDGSKGTGPNTLIIPFHTTAEGNKLEHFLRSDDYKAMALATKTSRQYLKLAFLEHLILTKILNKSKSKSKSKYTRKTRANNRVIKTRKNT